MGICEQPDVQCRLASVVCLCTLGGGVAGTCCMCSAGKVFARGGLAGILQSPDLRLAPVNNSVVVPKNPIVLPRRQQRFHTTHSVIRRPVAFPARMPRVTPPPALCDVERRLALWCEWAAEHVGRQFSRQVDSV